MGDLATTVPRRTCLQARPLVVVLHTEAEPASAQHLIQAWAPLVPAARFVTVAVAPQDVGTTVARLRTLVPQNARGGVPGSAHTVLVGVCGAADLALQASFGPDAWVCAGVLACGPPSLPLAALAWSGASGGTAKLRLVWTARDSLHGSAVMGGLLRCFRAAGLDAQGAVLDGPDGGSTETDEGCERTESLVRLGGAYLAELVAATLDAS